jgi:RNA polymerase sigma factor (sigma-70 family)
MEEQKVHVTEVQLETSEEALLQWVNKNLPRIKGHARKYLHYSPYELEEFIQQAYESALKASDDSVRRGISFETLFWSSFRIACLRMTYTRGEIIEAYHEEFLEFGDAEMMATRVPMDLLDGEEGIIRAIDGCPDDINPIDGLSPEERNILAKEVLGLMLPKEKQAWEHLITGCSTRETARFMGVSRQRIQNLIKKGIRRARKNLALE